MNTPNVIVLVFIPDAMSYTLNHSYWDDNSTGSPVVGATDYCLDPVILEAIGPCEDTGWIVGFITQPYCGAANTDYLETALFYPFSWYARPPLYDESSGLPPPGLFTPPYAMRCSSLIANVELEADVEYL